MEGPEKDLLEQNFLEVYDKFKFSFYRKVFSQVHEREGSLTAMEAFSLEVINQLGRPTIGKFAEFLNISQSNATYKAVSYARAICTRRTPARTNGSIIWCSRTSTTATSA